MRKLILVLKYPQAVQQWRNWANAEKEINFRRDPESGNRCTACYAAAELQYFLSRSMPDLVLSVAENVPASGPYIELEIIGNDFTGAFELKHAGDGVKVTGFGRNGLLNGVYELLRIHGWRWLEPGVYGESAPEHPSLDFLRTDMRYTPSFKHRMIDQYRESDDSMELLQWFSRNRLNVVFYKPATGKFADKLGMLSRKGGHLLQTIMKPDTPMEDGRTLWEAHSEWCGLPTDGNRKKATATKIQLCLSNESMIEWLSARVCKILQTEMKDVDILDLWGFDTWGKTCGCPGCTRLGNGSDQNLYLLSRIQEYLQQHLNRPVMLNTVSYEGTATMDPPTKPVPQNLIDTGCMVIFYPISRCYRHPLQDCTCRHNRVYDDSMAGWHRIAGGLALWSGEYYNVSKYEDMPLVFGKLICQEMRYYHAYGCTGATYMHNFSPNWGVRALTQLLHCQYAWNVHTDDDAFIAEYFARKYGIHAAKMRRIYNRLEAAYKDIGTWRNWRNSVLDHLLAWDPADKTEEITSFHYPAEKTVLAVLKKAAADADAAVRMLRKVLTSEQQRNWRDLPPEKDLPPVRTPVEQDKIRYYDKQEHRIGEDLRGAVYGAEMLRIQYLLMKYHYAVLNGRTGNREWAAVEKCAAVLNDMLVPVTYENPGPGVQNKDGLSRAQVRMTLTRCRGYRIRKMDGDAD